MSLLSYTELIELVRAGVVEHCPEDLVNGASIDITLSNRILFEQRISNRNLVDFRRRDSLALSTLLMDYYDLAPGEFILAASQQVFNLPNDIAAHYTLKSSMARIGLNHLNAG